MRPAEYDIMFHAEQTHWWYQALRAVLRKHLDGLDSPRLLDCGCGTGANLAAFGASCSLSAGIDASPLGLRHCRARGLRRLAQADTSALPFATGHFDVLISCDVLCHANVTDPAAALCEMRRVLKPGGILLLNLPAFAWLASQHDTAVANARRFTRREVLGLLAEAGLRPVSTTYWNTLLFPLVAAHRLVQIGNSTHGASDVAATNNPLLAGLARFALGLERAWLRLAPLPFGLSIFAVARRVD